MRFIFEVVLGGLVRDSILGDYKGVRVYRLGYFFEEIYMFLGFCVVLKRERVF